jgi:hypothetical protein
MEKDGYIVLFGSVVVVVEPAAAISAAALHCSVPPFSFLVSLLAPTTVLCLEVV